jgi:hypothetical protein
MRRSIVKQLGALLLLVMMLMVSGCGSSISVNNDYDVNAPFADYKTYDWMPQPAAAPGNAKTAVQRNDLLDKRIKNAVADVLVEKGLVPDAANPDVLLAYHVGVKDKVQVTDWGYRYGDAYWGWGGRDIDVYNYKEGTLIIDMIDAGTNQLVWRGAGQKALDDGKQTPQKSDELIRKVVGKIMSQYPPKR